MTDHFCTIFESFEYQRVPLLNNICDKKLTHDDRKVRGEKRRSTFNISLNGLAKYHVTTFLSLFEGQSCKHVLYKNIFVKKSENKNLSVDFLYVAQTSGHFLSLFKEQ